MNFKMMVDVAGALKNVFIPLVSKALQEKYTANGDGHSGVMDTAAKAIADAHVPSIVGSIVSELHNGTFTASFTHADVSAAADSYAHNVKPTYTPQDMIAAFKAGADFSAAHAGYTLQDEANAAIGSAPPTPTIAETVVNDVVGIAGAAATGGVPAAVAEAASDAVEVAANHWGYAEAEAAKPDDAPAPIN